MSDQTPTQQTMNSGTSTKLEKGKSPKTKMLTPDDVQKTIEFSGAQQQPEGPITDLAIFRTAVAKAQLAGDEFLEVSEEIFNFICNGQETAYINYSSPAVKIYRAGTKANQDRLDKMTLDQRAKHLADEWRAANPDKI